MIHSKNSVLKIAIVHDYIKEFGGAERVLEALTEIYPNAPIYTAFCDKNSSAYSKFKNKKIIQSWFGFLPFSSKLASPLRFLIPFIWGSFDFKDYDVVISSASWYVTKGFGRNQKSPIEICYCHTPPRWLYGYTTSVNFQKYAIVRIYALVVGHFLRMYDFNRAQKVNFFIANSKEVAARIQKFYRRDSTVIYPPVSISRGPVAPSSRPMSSVTSSLRVLDGTPSGRATPYYFIVSRLVGAKGLEIAVEAAKRENLKLKIAGAPAGYYFEFNKLKDKSTSNIEFLGQVTDEELAKLYKQAKAFLALSKDEDFGITPVESMMAGTPVIAFNGGGYKETVIDPSNSSGQAPTGVLFEDYSVNGLISAIKRFENLRIDSKDCIEQAEKFSKERFKKEIKDFVRLKIK